MIMEGCNVKENVNVAEEIEEMLGEQIDKLLGEIPPVTSNYQCTSNGNNLLSGGGGGRGGDHHGNGNGNGNENGTNEGAGFGKYDDRFRSFIFNKYRNGSSPVSGFSLHSHGSCGSLMSGGQSMSENGSITPPPIEDLRSYLNSGNYLQSDGLRVDELESHMGSGYYNHLNGLRLGSSAGESVDELGLCNRMNNIRIGSEVDNSLSSGGSGFRVLDQPDFRLLEPPLGPSYPDVGLPLWNSQQILLSAQWEKSMRRQNHKFEAGSSSRNMSPSLRRASAENYSYYARQNGVTLNQGNETFKMSSYPGENQLRQRFNMDPAVGYGVQNWRARESLNAAIQRGNFESLKTEGNVIFQGDSSKYKINKDYSCPSGQTRGYIHSIGSGKRLFKQPQVNGQFDNGGNAESGSTGVIFSSFPVPLKYNSLAEAQGNIYSLAKDQHGCRFLQKMFDGGSPDVVHMIFKEIIEHIVELMMNPFGNYLIQKLIDVCGEEQKMEILLTVTEKPYELVKISLNSHGSRVVQKLIETLKDKQQISLVISALEHGFLDLMKDLNGNHVVQHCLDWFTADDNRFIFSAAAKHCVEIATHQHGCCVMQPCISHSTGQYRENLVNEISANGLLLAQDRYGNYVVQYVLDLKSPSATSNFITQFEGNYVHLSTQKCSSHVVQRCLATFEPDICSRVIHELLATAGFEQLLQDQYANYVISTALEVSQGPLKNILVEAIEPHLAILRNSPYSKRIYSLLLRN